jgi:hypothetical protein
VGVASDVGACSATGARPDHHVTYRTKPAEVEALSGWNATVLTITSNR